MTDLTQEYTDRLTYQKHGLPDGFTLQRGDDGMVRYAAPPSLAGQYLVKPDASGDIVTPDAASAIDSAVNYITDIGQGLLHGASRGAHEINRMIPGAPAIEAMGGAAFDVMGINPAIKPPTTFPGQLASGLGQALPGMIPAMRALKMAGYGPAVADIVGGVIGDFATSGKTEADGIAEMIAMIPGDKAQEISQIVSDFVTSDNATIQDLNSRLVGALPGAVLGPLVNGLGSLVAMAKNSGAAQDIVTMISSRWAERKSPVPMGMSIEDVGNFELFPGQSVTPDMKLSDTPMNPTTLPTMKEVLDIRSQQMQLKAKDRVGPSGDNMFDTTPEGYNKSHAAQTPVPVPRAPDGMKLPLGNRARPVADMTDLIAARLAERMTPYLGTAAQYFYHTGPLVDKAVALGIPEATARQQLKDFALNYAATSPRTMTEQNLRNASLASAKHNAGIDITEVVGPGSGGINEHGYPMMIGDSGIHGKLLKDIKGNQGISNDTNPKPHTFAENVAGNLDGVTVDTHAIRGALDAMNEIQPGSIPDGFIKPEYLDQYKADPAQLNPATWLNDTLGSQKVGGKSMQTEYAVFSDIYRKAAEILGVSPAEAQSLGWFGSGSRTGLASDLKTVVELINDRIDVTAQLTGRDKDTIFKGFMEGKIPLLSIGGAGLLAAGVDQPDAQSTPLDVTITPKDKGGAK
jgi:hypothetical protein